MIKQIIFKNIKFSNITHNHFKKIISKSGYFVFPAAPALAQINSKNNYYKALKKGISYNAIVNNSELTNVGESVSAKFGHDESLRNVMKNILFIYRIEFDCE